MPKRVVSADEWFTNDDNLDEAERLIRSGLTVWDVVVELECEVGNATSGTVEVSGLYRFIEDLGVELGRWQGPDPEPPDPLYAYKCYVEKYGLEG